jgi:hypothetical protein
MNHETGLHCKVKFLGGPKDGETRVWPIGWMSEHVVFPCRDHLRNDKYWIYERQTELHVEDGQMVIHYKYLECNKLTDSSVSR